jgi:hypothetical protein
MGRRTIPERKVSGSFVETWRAVKHVLKIYVGRRHQTCETRIKERVICLLDSAFPTHIPRPEIIRTRQPPLDVEIWQGEIPTC